MRKIKVKKWLVLCSIIAGLVIFGLFSFPKVFPSVPKVEKTTTFQKTKEQKEEKRTAEDTKGPKNAYKYSKLQQSLRDLKQDVEQVKPNEKAEQDETGTAGDNGTE